MAEPTDADATPLFEVEALHVSTTDGIEILKGVDLVVGHGEVHALMGPNGSGKSTLAAVLLGSPEYVVTSGSIRFRGDEITDWPPDVRGKAGLPSHSSTRSRSPAYRSSTSSGSPCRPVRASTSLSWNSA